MQADPTKLELLHKEYSVKKDSYKEEQKDSILDRVCWHSVISVTREVSVKSFEIQIIFKTV